jgi:hypothetical protein
VESADEVLLAVRANGPVRFDPALGFHLYGTDACLTAHRLGLRNVVVDAPAFHNSIGGQRTAAFHAARATLLAKWADVRPIHSNVGRLDTMVAERISPPPDGFETVAAQRRELAQLRSDLRASRAELARMRASRLWQVREWLRRSFRRAGMAP